MLFAKKKMYGRFTFRGLKTSEMSVGSEFTIYKQSKAAYQKILVYT